MIKEGNNITCPHCGADTIVRRQRIPLENFGEFAEALVCSFCRQKVAEVVESKADSADSASSRLAALLGVTPEKITISKGAGHRRDCRNCRHLIQHPFKFVCGVTMQETEPMKDCDKFTPAEEK